MMYFRRGSPLARSASAIAPQSTPLRGSCVMSMAVTMPMPPSLTHGLWSLDRLAWAASPMVPSDDFARFGAASSICCRRTSRDLARRQLICGRIPLVYGKTAAPIAAVELPFVRIDDLPGDALPERMKPKVYLINLDTDHERLARMAAILGNLEMSYERVPAIRGFDFPDWLIPYFLNEHGRIGSKLGAGEIGCYASHLM